MGKRSMIMILALALAIYVMVRFATVGLKTHDGYKISVPYNGYSKTTYYTNKYTEKDGCIIFTDDWGKKRKICGVYEIEGY